MVALEAVIANLVVVTGGIAVVITLVVVVGWFCVDVIYVHLLFHIGNWSNCGRCRVSFHVEA